MSVSISAEGSGVVFAVYVTPRAGKTEVVGEREGALWVRLAAPPVEGKANEALVELLAKRLGVPKSSVEIVVGATGRSKRVRVAGISAEDVRERLWAT